MARRGQGLRPHRAPWAAPAVARVLALPLALMLALATTGCSSEPEVAIEGEPAEAVARAAGRSQGTLRFGVHVRITLDPFVATQAAEGIVEPDGDTHTTITTSVENTAAGGAEAPGTFDALGGTREVIVTGGVLYLRDADGGERSGRRPLPEGIAWVASDAAPDSAAAGDVTGFLQARAILEMLRDVAEVSEDRGTTEVDGEPVRWLRAVAPGAEGEDRLVPPGTVVDVAIDRDGHVRRVAFEVEDAAGPRTRVIVDYHDHDVDESVEPPPADATIDEDELGGSGSGS